MSVRHVRTGERAFPDHTWNRLQWFNKSCRHLIADNLGWFKNHDGSEGGRTVEDFVRLKGETVRRGKLVQGMNGDFEYVEPE